MFKRPRIPIPPIAEGPAGARRRLAEVLLVTRNPDPPGAFAVLAEDPGLVDLLVQWPGDDPEDLWTRLVDRLAALAEAQRCVRCGTCCRRSSPTLYLEDLRSIETGHLQRSSLYALRAGERVRSPRLREHQILTEDLIKLRERPDGACLLLDDHLCRDYEHRPLQCRNLECWSGKHAGDLADRERLGRRHLFASDGTATRLIEEYDLKLPAAKLIGSIDAALDGDREAARAAVTFIDLDRRLRAGIVQKYGRGENELDLLLGREALEVVRGYGVVIALDDEGEPALRSR